MGYDLQSSNNYTAHHQRMVIDSIDVALIRTSVFC